MRLLLQQRLAAACRWCLLLAYAVAFSPPKEFDVASSRRMRSASVLGAAFQPLDDSNMNDLLFRPSDGRAVLVDACAPWCGPCKLIEPYLESCAKKHSDKLTVIKYDVEGGNNSNLKVEMLLQGVMISGLPTLVIYKDGAPLGQHSGVITEEGLEEWLDDNLFSRMDELGAGNASSNAEKTNDSTADESAAGGKRGFVSFASQADDYMLSGQ